jgi:hypothetical protein
MPSTIRSGRRCSLTHSLAPQRRGHSSARALREWRRTGVGRCALACARAGARLHRRREVATPGFSQLGSQRKQRRSAFGLRNELRRSGALVLRRLGLGLDPPDFDGFARRCFGGVAYSLNSDRSASPPMRENACVRSGRCRNGRKARADPKPPLTTVPHRTETETCCGRGTSCSSSSMEV